MSIQHIISDDAEQAIEQSGADISRDAFFDVVEAHQLDVEEHFDDYLDMIEDGAWTLVHEGDDVLVFADTTGHHWGDIFDYLDVKTDPETRNAVVRAHHAAAHRLCDHSWSVSDPVVIQRPTNPVASRDLVERHLMWLMEECDLSGGVALDYLMVEWRGLSQNQWAKRSGKSQQTVSQNVNNALTNVVR